MLRDKTGPEAKDINTKLTSKEESMRLVEKMANTAIGLILVTSKDLCFSCTADRRSLKCRLKCFFVVVNLTDLPEIACDALA